MSDKEDMKSILEACRKIGPMDIGLIQNLEESSYENNEEYCADTMHGTNYLQFSHDEDEYKK